MKLRILLITVVLAVFVRGAVCAQTESADIEYNALFEQVNAYIEAGDYAAAIPLLKRMHELNPGELDIVEVLGIFYVNLPDERPALTNALFWLTEAEKRGSLNDIVYYNLACVYSLKRDVKKAEEAMNKALALGFSDFKSMSNDYDLVNFRNGSWWKSIANNYTQIEQQLTLFNEFVSSGDEKSIADRITFYSGMVTAFRKLAPHISALQSGPLYFLASSYENIRNYAAAEQNYLEVKAIKEKVLGKEHPDYVTLITSLGMMYYNMGDYAKAESYYLEARAFCEKVFGKEHPYYVSLLAKLGTLYYNMGDYTKAESYYLEARAFCEKVFGKEHPEYAVSLISLGLVYSGMGNNTVAEKYYLEAKAIQEKTLGKNHTDYAQTLNNMGLMYSNMGNYTAAEKYYLEAKAIREKTLGKNHPDYAESLRSLGMLYYLMGDYASAEQDCLEAKAIQEKILGKNHSDYTVSLIGLGTLYMSMGNYVLAEQSLLEAAILGKEDSGYALLLDCLGMLYYMMGNYTAAEKYYLEAKAIQEKAPGKEHPSYSILLNNLGLLYISMGNYVSAERNFLEAKALTEKTLGKESPNYIASLSSLGILYNNMGNYVSAERNFLEAKALTEKTLGKEHPNYALFLNLIYIMYLSAKDYPKALAYKQEETFLTTTQVNRNFSFLSEQQRSAYWNLYSRFFELSNSLSFFHPVSASNILNYDSALFSKGLLLRTANAVRDAIYASGNRTLINQFEELGRLRQQISALRQSGGNETYIQSFETQAETLDKSLTQSSAAFREFQADLAVNWQSVQKSLQRNEAAIEFVSFKIYDKGWTDKTQYAALVVKPGMNAPAWVPLCEEGALTALFDQIKDWADPKYEALLFYDDNGLALYNAVWQPLEKVLEGVAAVYYSPSGLLHKISFNAIPVKGNTSVRLMDAYDLNLVSSTREVVNRRNQNAGRPSSAVVYGGLEYTVDADTMRRESLAFNLPETGTRVSAVLPASGSRGGSWNFLGGSLNESRDIESLLKGRQMMVTLYSGAKGNKESFKALDGKRTSIIHLATHGFFMEDVEKDREKQERLERLGGGQRAYENPLLRSGLILAGGNNAWTGRGVEGVENGILFADDVAKMNLLGTELVALSACVTALGKVNNSEGVFGLQRAFKLAGAQTLVMSLWEVDDKGTSMIMSELYRNWLSGMSKQEAFKKAQKTLRSNPDFALPYYWAAFVMMD